MGSALDNDFDGRLDGRRIALSFSGVSIKGVCGSSSRSLCPATSSADEPASM